MLDSQDQNNVAFLAFCERSGESQAKLKIVFKNPLQVDCWLLTGYWNIICMISLKMTNFSLLMRFSFKCVIFSTLFWS